MLAFCHVAIIESGVGSMIWENRKLVTNEPVQFEK